uniref:Uncharacterized protein n=1 Tax=virus sp. ctr1v16 TaxID=2825823 RepID=A0A8S5RPT0_9VIRU|nr:MAG TPA: hypothetical protein [virus sp. ctr1v16]
MKLLKNGIFQAVELEYYAEKEELKVQFKKVFFGLFQVILRNHKNSEEEEKNREIYKMCY